jgi:hypothetical protein
MLFDDTYKMILEELDTSFCQLFKYRGATASPTQQGPVRFGAAPDGFKGSKDGMNTSTLPSELFPQTKNLSRKELKKIENKQASLRKQRLLLKKLRQKKYGK